MVRDIALGSRPQRLDASIEKRVELHAHTKMSAMDALSNVTQLIARAADFGHAAIAITDHGVIQAFPEALAAGKKYGVKIIYGMEGYLIEDEWLGKKKQRPYHISILIAEPPGVKNLYRLVSDSHLKHFYRHPRILRSQLEKYRGGLLLGSACEQGELFLRMREGASEDELEVIARRYDYLEIMPRENNRFLIREGRLASEDELLNLNRRIYELGKRLGVPVVATGDVHFLEPEDEVFRSILHTGMGYADAALQAPLFFQTTDEMLAEFAYLGEAEAREVVIKTSWEIADRVGIIEPLKRTFHPPRLPNAEEELEQLAFARAREVYGKPLPDLVAKRLAREIMAINNHRFASLFLIARRLVQKSLADGYLVGSRGSVGSSLTATMLGITEVNPLPGHYLCSQCRRIEMNPEPGIGADLPERQCPACQTLMEKTGFDIPFEVFMGFKGDKMPDIDLNFSGEYQTQAHKYLEEIFDREHIFRAGTISTVAERTAFGFVKKYLEGNKLVVREVEVNRLTRGCAGVKKTTGQHPGGIMIVPNDMDIHDFTPVQRPADDHTSGIITTHFDYHAIHDALLKLDILGHDDPTSLRRLGDGTGVEVCSIPLDDADTLKIFSGLESLQVSKEDIGTSVGTLGIPEFGTEFVRQMLEVTRPTKFSELVCISGLSHGTDVWLNNAADLIKAGTAKLATVISARDDIMNYLISLRLEPVVAFKIMESVRKGQGVAPEHEQAMREYGVPDWYIESCKKIKYIFPKAHAVAYCIMAFRIAYFKVHFPAAFYANYFSLNAECFDAELIIQGERPGVRKYLQDLKNHPELTAKEKSNLVVLEVVQEAFLRGIRFRPVSLMESDPQGFKITAENELLPPLISLSGLGLTCALRMAEERLVRPFRSSEELARRTGANKNVVEIMTQHGCLGGLPKTDQTTLFQ
jgi:DNA polymerase-3 subunit alpha (Gram-positive type)